MIFDIYNPPLCADSSLDSDLSITQDYTIADAGTESISPGDWVDVDVLPKDPDWGYSYQVCNLYPNYVGVLILQNPMDDPAIWYYSETQVSPSSITENFRRVSRS